MPDPGRVFGYNRTMYVYGNPLLFNDPSGHANDKAIHDSNGGPPLTEAQIDALESTYQDLGIDWDDTPNAYHAILNDSGLGNRTQYADSGRTVSQEGTIRTQRLLVHPCLQDGD